MTSLPRETIVDRLPFLGLDIEGEDADSIRIEYNPNRADFSTDYGIARALKGLVGSELGPPEYRVAPPDISLRVDKNLSTVRPFIACATARGLSLDDETIRQLISMQEDLHNGIARRRRKAAIGLHDLDAVRPPLEYVGMPASYSFVPLGSADDLMTIGQILTKTETGRQYGHLLKDAPVYPILRDSAGTVLSLPPIINGNRTRVDARTKNLLVDVTSTDERIGEEALAIICAALSDAGGKLGAVEVVYPSSDAKAASKKKVTPDMSPTFMRFDQRLTADIVGLNLSSTDMARCLAKSRVGLDARGQAIVPRYRVDILHPIDLTEEVVIGYGLDKVEPVYPAATEPGSFSRDNVAFDRVASSVAMAGFTETMSFDLLDLASCYTKFGRSPEGRVEVENPRTVEHSLLRDSILPSLMSVLSRNVQAAYPQRVYEVGRVFTRSGGRVTESHRLAALSAHSSASFSEAKMYLEAIVSMHLGGEVSTAPSSHWAFEDGRCAEVRLGAQVLGHIGEVKASALASFGLDVPVAGFEVDLGPFIIT